jgi:hypothetical protein
LQVFLGFANCVLPAPLAAGVKSNGEERRLSTALATFELSAGVARIEGGPFPDCTTLASVTLDLAMATAHTSAQALLLLAVSQLGKLALPA